MFPEIERADSPDYEIFMHSTGFVQEILRNHLKDMEVTCRRQRNKVSNFFLYGLVRTYTYI